MESIPEKVDYLKEDPIISGQEVALISFVEPKQQRLLQNKESFIATRFLKGFIEEYKQAIEYKTLNPDVELSEEVQKKLDISYENIRDKYYEYQKYNLTQLENEFNKEHNKNKVPTVTGFKVRGVYPNQLVTSGKVKELQQLEPAINVYCAPVGKWIPYIPLNDQEIKSEYQTEQLNELLGKKEDEHIKKELEYEHRKMDLIKKTNEETEKKKEQQGKDDVLIEEIVDELEKPDPKPEPEPKAKKKRGRPKKANKAGGKRLNKKK